MLTGRHFNASRDSAVTSPWSDWRRWWSSCWSSINTVSICGLRFVHTGCGALRHRAACWVVFVAYRKIPHRTVPHRNAPLEYCSVVWGHNLSKKQSNQPESIQKKAICIIYRVTQQMSYDSLLYCSNITRQMFPTSKKVFYINFGPIFMPTSSAPAATWQRCYFQVAFELGRIARLNDPFRCMPLLTMKWSFCCVHRSLDSQCFSMGQSTTPQHCPFSQESRLHLIHDSLGSRESAPKRHLDRFSRFCTVHQCDQHRDRQTHRQTHKHTDDATCDICRNRPHQC